MKLNVKNLHLENGQMNNVAYQIVKLSLKKISIIMSNLPTDPDKYSVMKEQTD